MSEAHFRFYAELNDFLPVRQQQTTFTHRFQGRPAVKDTIEALGVPHTEVDLILVNGRSVDFSHQLQDGDQVSVYPVFESIDISPVLKVRPEPLRETRFVLDTHLGQLARYLRMLGFDSLYSNDLDDDQLARLSSQGGRILLTRDRGLLKRNEVTHGYCVRANNPREQLKEALERFDLYDAISPFQRCILCNGLLEPVPKEEILERLPQKTRQHYDEFRRCRSCGQIFWPGTHYQRMQAFIRDLLEERREPSA